MVDVKESFIALKIIGTLDHVLKLSIPKKINILWFQSII